MRKSFCGEDLRGAYLIGADLRGADLRGADLTGADLRGADLRGADLRGADLTGADLGGADLRGADLTKADLTEADLTGADLTGADLGGAINVPFIPMACPDYGSFIGWKKVKNLGKYYIVKLLIPEDARRSSGTGRKCRCDKAVVMEIQTLDGAVADIDCAYSLRSALFHFDKFIYHVGDTVTPEFDFCEDRFMECASGIHFFTNRQEAVDYLFV